MGLDICHSILHAGLWCVLRGLKGREKDKLQNSLSPVLAPPFPQGTIVIGHCAGSWAEKHWGWWYWSLQHVDMTTI